MNDERLWTVHVTGMEEVIDKVWMTLKGKRYGQNVWEVTYTLYDQTYPHRIDKLRIQADHEIDVFYKFQARVKSWTPQVPFYGRNIAVKWFEKEEVQ